MNIFPDKIKLYIKQSGMTSKAVCQKAGSSRAALYDWFSSGNMPSEKNIRKLAALINAPVDEISELNPNIPVSEKNLSEMAAPLLEINSIKKSEHSDEYNNILNSIYSLDKKYSQVSLIIKALFTSLDSIIYIKDIGNKYVIVNKTFLQSLSLDSDMNVNGLEDEAFFSILEAEYNKKEDEKILIDCEPLINKECNIPGSRKKKWAIVSKLPVFDSANKLIGLIAIYSDITNRKEEEFRRLVLEKTIDNIKDFIFVGHYVHGEYDYLYFNNAFKNIVDWQDDFLFRHPKDWTDYLHTDDVKAYSEFINQSFYPRMMEFRIINPNTKDKKWISFKLNGNKDVQYGIMTDITESKEMQKNRELLETCVNHTKDSISIVDYETMQYLYLNKSHEKIFGYSNEEFYKDGVEFAIENCLYAEDREKARENYIKTWKPSSKTETLNYRICRPDGESRWIESVRGTAEFLGNPCVISVQRDVTEYKKLEEKRKILECCINNMSEAAAIMDQETQEFLYMNKAREILYGYSNENFFEKATLNFEVQF
jgi:PAS domain S-box-containing protein